LELLNALIIIIICLFYLCCFLILYTAIIAKLRNEKGAYQNNLAIFFVLFISLTINLVITNFSNLSNINFIEFPFDILIFFFILFFLPLYIVFIFNENHKQKKKKEEIITYGYSHSNLLPLKYEVYRKLSHLVVLGIILFYFSLGFWTQNIFINILNYLPGIVSDIFYSIFPIESDDMIFTQYLVVFLVGISLLGLLTADFTRLIKPSLYPLKKVNRILREKEEHMRLGPQISMAIGCFSIIILYGLFQPIGPLVICTAMTMAIFGDMAANLIGRLYGKKKIRNTNKSYEGLFSGVLVAFLSGIILFFILEVYQIINLILFILFPIIGAIIIGVLDFIDLEIDDNLTYPFFISTILFFLYFIFY